MTRPSGYRQPPGWKTTVRRVIARDRGVCYLCGQPGADTADHVQPVSQGGSHHDGNLRAAHQQPCHAAKTERERRAAHATAMHKRRDTRQPEPHPGLN